ncbi:protein RALF-like 34 [Magnolia sinica]|uniref:protein RALF-like 34 n=1 Tax=Magnolia sinica TaxID=86752 RepID=UPI00265A1F6A|nr:protein RALF-like 34 [Magnolia sinica]
MASPSLPTLLISLLLISTYTHCIQAQVDGSSSMQLTTESLEWPYSNSMYGFDDDMEDEDVDVNGMMMSARRALYWRIHYYISYGALSANRIPCPPRSGRSYYTHNCYKARGPAHPYSRGCSRITQCR